MKGLFKIHSSSDLITSLSPNPPPPPHMNAYPRAPIKKSHTTGPDYKPQNPYYPTVATGAQFKPLPNPSNKHPQHYNPYSSEYGHASIQPPAPSDRRPSQVTPFYERKRRPSARSSSRTRDESTETDFYSNGSRDNLAQTRTRTPLSVSSRGPTPISVNSRGQTPLSNSSKENVSKEGTSNSIFPQVKSCKSNNSTPAMVEENKTAEDSASASLIQSKLASQSNSADSTNITTASPIPNCISPLKIASLITVASSVSGQYGQLNTHFNLLEPISPISPIILHPDDSFCDACKIPTSNNSRLQGASSIDDNSMQIIEPFERYLVDTLAAIDNSPNLNSSSKWFLPSPTLENSYKENNKRLSRSFTAPRISKRQSSLPIQRSPNSPNQNSSSTFNSPEPAQFPTFTAINHSISDSASVSSSRGASTSSTLGHKSASSSFSSNEASSIVIDDRKAHVLHLQSPIMPSGFDYERFHQLRVEGTKQKPYTFEYRITEVEQNPDMTSSEQTPLCASPRTGSYGETHERPEFKQDIEYSQSCIPTSLHAPELDDTLSHSCLSPKSKHVIISAPFVSELKHSVDGLRPRFESVPIPSGRTPLLQSQYVSTGSLGSLRPSNLKQETDTGKVLCAHNVNTGVTTKQILIRDNETPPSLTKINERSIFLNKDLPVTPTREPTILQPPRGRFHQGNQPVSYYEWDAIHANLSMISSNIDKWDEIENDIQDLLNGSQYKVPECSSSVTPKSSGRIQDMQDGRKISTSRHTTSASSQESGAPRAVSMKNMERIIPCQSIISPSQRQCKVTPLLNASMGIDEEELLPPPMKSSILLASPSSPSSVYSDPPPQSNLTLSLPNIPHPIVQHQYDNSYQELIQDKPPFGLNIHTTKKSHVNNLTDMHSSPTRSRSVPSLLFDSDSKEVTDDDYLQAVTVIDKKATPSFSAWNNFPAASKHLFSERRPRFMSTAAPSTSAPSEENSFPWLSHTNQYESPYGALGKMQDRGFPLTQDGEVGPFATSSSKVPLSALQQQQQPNTQENLSRLDTWRRKLRKPSINMLRHNN